MGCTLLRSPCVRDLSLGISLFLAANAERSQRRKVFYSQSQVRGSLSRNRNLGTSQLMMCPASLHFVGMILSDVPPDEHPEIAYVCIVSEDIWPTATRISLPFDPKLQLAFARSPTITLQVYKRSNITSAIKYVWAFFSPSQVGRQYS